jgi:hypothetical protein
VIAAVAIAVFDFVAFSITTTVAGCRFDADVLPNFTCREGPLQHPTEFILSLPILFVVAPLVTAFGPTTPNPQFMNLLYGFDVILVLALAYPLIVLIARWRVRRGGVTPRSH